MRASAARTWASSSSGIALVVVVERGADLGGDGEAGRHRQADRGHLGQVGALAAEQVLHVGAALVVAGAEAVHPLGHRGPPFNLRYAKNRRRDPWSPEPGAAGANDCGASPVPAR